MNTADSVTSDRYVIKGKSYVRVTTLLNAVGLVDFSRIPERDRAYYMSRGKANHCLFEDIENGVDGNFTYDPRVEVYRAGHARFLRETGFKAIKGGIEKRVKATWDRFGITGPMESAGIAGTLDRLGMMQGRLVLIDYKTTSLVPSAKPGLPSPTEIQTAAYLLMLPYAFHEVDRFGVAVRNDGKYRMSEKYPIKNKEQALAYIHQFCKETR